MSLSKNANLFFDLEKVLRLKFLDHNSRSKGLCMEIKTSSEIINLPRVDSDARSALLPAEFDRFHQLNRRAHRGERSSLNFY